MAKIQTFSISIGTSACDCGCFFCVSHTTGFDQLPESLAINLPNFRKAARFALMGGCTTVLMTGKGEPTLYPQEISNYLTALEEFNFPFIEIQTNAVRIGQIAQILKDEGLTDAATSDAIHNADVCQKIVKVLSPRNLMSLFHCLRNWKVDGLNTIAISTVGTIHPDHNKRVYLHHRDIQYPDLTTTINFLHKLGFAVRVCVMMQRGMVEQFGDVQATARWCKERGVEQLTVRSIRKPLLPVMGASSYVDYITNNGLTDEEIDRVREGLEKLGNKLLTLMQGNHQARVYDLDGQNVCLSDCLTVESDSDNIRTLIFFSDGKLVFDWQFPGARLL